MHLFEFSPLYVFKCILKLSAREDAKPWGAPTRVLGRREEEREKKAKEKVAKEEKKSVEKMIENLIDNLLSATVSEQMKDSISSVRDMKRKGEPSKESKKGTRCLVLHY